MSEGGDNNLGLSCTAEELFLGHTPLIERRDNGYFVRPQAELERLLGRAYGADIDLERLMPGFATIAGALGIKNLSLAQIAAVHLRLPDLPDTIARVTVEAEDLLIKLDRSNERFARSWNETEHPRTGTPPNPGWFAPTNGSSEGNAPSQVAAGDREERRPEEELDPLAQVRQAQWDAGIAGLRRIDPNNPQITYFANLGAAPSQAALDRLNDEIEAAVIKRVSTKVMPGGVPIGRAGSGRDIREVPGGAEAAEALFDYLRVEGSIHRSDPNMTIVSLPRRVGYITFRRVSSSGNPAIDVNVPGVRLKIHFPSGGKHGH